MKKVSVRFLVALGAFALSAAWFFLSWQLEVDPSSKGASTRTFPLIVTTLMLVFSAVICVQEYLAARKTKDGGEAAAQKGDILRVAALVAAMLVYVVLLKPVGFVISSTGLLLIAMLLYGSKNKWVSILIAVAFPIGLKLLFEYALKMPLP